MSSAARFLLEFEATGDQEVVAKIKAVGEAGKQTATDLESLRGIEDPFEPIATGADAAVAPIEGVGTAAEGAVTPLGELGTTAEEGVTALTDIGSAADTAVTPIEGVGTATEGLGGIFSGAGTEAETFGGAMDAIGGNAEAATGGLTDANTVVGDFGDAASTSADQSAGFGDTVKGMSGSIVAIGGAIGGAVSAFFRYQDAQLKVQKAQNAVARANEAVRKTTENIQAILATATSNTDAIAAANTRYVAAQARVNQLQREGITSGEEYNAANKELQDSQAALSAELAKGGGDAKKLTNEMNKLEIQEGKAATQAATLEKANRQSNQTIMDGVLQAATLAGSIVQIGQGMAKTAGPIGKMTMGLRGLSGALTAVTGVGLGGLTAALGIGAAAVGVFMGAVLALSKAPYDLIIGKFDQLGKKMGETFPGLKDALQSTGDAFRSSLSFLAKGTTDTIKALTGLDLESKIVGKSFSDLVQEFMKLGTVGVPEVDAALKSFIETGKKAGMTDKEIIELAKQHNAEFENVAASTDKAASATDKLAQTQTNMGTTAADAEKWISDLAIGYNEMGVNAARASAEGDDLVGNLVTERATAAGAATEIENLGAGYFTLSDNMQAASAEAANNATANNEAADTILKMIGNVNRQEEAMSEVNLAYAESESKLADLNTVMSDSATHHKAVATAVNETAAALMEESIQLEAAIQSADSVSQAQMRLANAQKQGTLEIKEYINGLDEAQAGEQAMVAELQRSGAAWSDIPPFVERNIDTLKLFGIAAKQGGEAARQAADMAAKAWQDATSEMGSEIEGLSDIFLKGGEDMGKATDEWFADLERKLGRNLTAAERAAAQGLADINTSATQAINNWQFGQLMGESIKQSGDEAATAFDAMGDQFGGKVGEVFHRAAEIIRQNPEMAAAVNEVMADVGTTAPQLLLDKLNTLPGAMGQIGTAGGTSLSQGIIDGVQQGAGAVEQELQAQDPGITEAGRTMGGNAGSAFVSEWDANVQLAGNALQSIVKTASTLKVEIPITANVQQAGAALASIVKTGSTLKVQIPVTADVSAAHQAIANLVTKPQTLVIKVTYQVAGTPPVVKPITTTITYAYKITGKPPSVKPIKSTIDYAYRITNKIPNPKEIKRFISYAYRVTNKIPNPPEIKRWITYKYRVVGSRPNPPNLNRTITYRYRTVGSRPAQFGMHENLAQDTMIAAHKGERVDITPGASAGNTTRTIESGVRGTKSAGEIVIPVTLMLDNKVLIRTVRRGLVEEVSGTM